jgi:transcriptional regulator with XRE-family HTH domain
MGRDDSGPASHRRTAEVEGRANPAPSQIGEALWRGRLRMGLSLHDVACRAGADLQTVSAIEDSDFTRLPSPQAAIAAARSYARVVDLPQKWVALTLAAELARFALRPFPSTRSVADPRLCFSEAETVAAPARSPTRPPNRV